MQLIIYQNGCKTIGFSNGKGQSAKMNSVICNIQKKGKLKESLFYIWDEPAYIGMCNYFRRNFL